MRTLVRLTVLAVIAAGLSFTLVGGADAEVEVVRECVPAPFVLGIGETCINVAEVNTSCSTFRENRVCIGVENGGDLGCHSSRGFSAVCVGLVNHDCSSSTAGDTVCVGLVNGSNPGGFGGCNSGGLAVCVGADNGTGFEGGCNDFGGASVCIGLVNGDGHVFGGGGCESRGLAVCVGGVNGAGFAAGCDSDGLAVCVGLSNAPSGKVSGCNGYGNGTAVCVLPALSQLGL